MLIRAIYRIQLNRQENHAPRFGIVFKPAKAGASACCDIQPENMLMLMLILMLMLKLQIRPYFLNVPLFNVNVFPDFEISARLLTRKSDHISRSRIPFFYLLPFSRMSKNCAIFVFLLFRFSKNFIFSILFL